MLERIKVFLLDDEEPGLKNLINLIERYLSADLEIIGSSRSPIQARAEVELLRPDLMFLDIQMPGMTGLEFLSTFGSIDFDVVFVTAHQDFALPAIKAGALDYILKPASIDDFKNAIQKYRKKHAEVRHAPDQNQRLALPNRNGYSLIPVSDVYYVHGDDNYSRVVLAGGESITVAKTLKDFEERLHPPRFFRVHKSDIINLGHVREYSMQDGGYVVMKDGTRIPISRRRMADFRMVIDSYLIGN